MEKRRFSLKNSKILDFIIVFCFFIFVSAFPTNLIFEEIKYQIILSSSLFLILVISLFIYIFKVFKERNKINCYELIYNLPYFLICFVNIIYLKNILNMSFSLETNYLILINVIIRCVAEELIFRYLFFKYFKHKNMYLLILISAALFSLTHLLNIVNGNIGAVLLQTVYTFLIGLVLALLYKKTNSLIYVSIFHILFNLFNQELILHISFNMFELNYILFISSFVVVFLMWFFISNYSVFTKKPSKS